MTSSVRFPSVAFRSPPAASPVLAAMASVARLSSAASGTMATTDSTKSNVCASGRSRAAASTTGTKASSQRSGELRISLSRRDIPSTFTTVKCVPVVSRSLLTG